VVTRRVGDVDYEVVRSDRGGATQIYHLNLLKAFDGYSDANGWCGVSIPSHYLVDCLVWEYQRQEQHLTLLLQWTFGQALTSDHTHKVARKVCSHPAPCHHSQL